MHLTYGLMKLELITYFYGMMRNFERTPYFLDFYLLLLFFPIVCSTLMNITTMTECLCILLDAPEMLAPECSTCSFVIILQEDCNSGMCIYT